MVKQSVIDNLRDEVMTAFDLYQSTMEAYNRGETTEKCVELTRLDWQQAKREYASASA